MGDKCFCHLNGYEVKDSNARSNIELLKTRATTIENTLPNKADKTYVDNAIKNIDIPDATAKGYYYMELPLGNIGIKENEYEYNELASSTFTKFDEFLNAISDIKQPKLVIANTTDSITNLDGVVIENPIPRYVELGNLTKTVVDGKTIYNMFGVCNSLRTYEDNYDFIADLLINGTESDSGYTIEHVFLNIKKIYLPTKEYIDEVVNKKPIYFLDFTDIGLITMDGGRSYTLPTENKELITKLFEEQWAKTNTLPTNIDNILFVFIFDNNHIGIGYTNNFNANGSISFMLYTDHQNISDYAITHYNIYIDSSIDSDNKKITLADKFTIAFQPYRSAIAKNFVYNNFLYKNNTNSYTPTSAYHPATKKYVDDSIANISTGGSVDLTNYYTKSEVDTSLSNKANTSHTHTKSDITDFPSIPTKTSDLTNDSGFLTAHQDISGKVDKTTYNSKVSEIDTSISSLETNMIAKVDTSTYNTKISSIDDELNTQMGYINNILGTSFNRYYGTTDPSNDEGNTGDIYIKYEA